jgi:hypothetical protein
MARRLSAGVRSQSRSGRDEQGMKTLRMLLPALFMVAAAAGCGRVEPTSPAPETPGPGVPSAIFAFAIVHGSEATSYGGSRAMDVKVKHLATGQTEVAFAGDFSGIAKNELTVSVSVTNAQAKDLASSSISPGRFTDDQIVFTIATWRTESEPVDYVNRDFTVELTFRRGPRL